MISLNCFIGVHKPALGVSISLDRTHYELIEECEHCKKVLDHMLFESARWHELPAKYRGMRNEKIL